MNRSLLFWIPSCVLICVLLTPQNALAQLRWDPKKPDPGFVRSPVGETPSVDPNSPDGRYFAAVSLMDKGRFKSACARLERLAKDQPQSPLSDKIDFRIAECLYHRKKYTASYERLRKLGLTSQHEFSTEAAQLELSIADALIHGGGKKILGFIPAGGEETGRDILRDFVDRNPHGPYADDALFLLADSYVSDGRYEEAAVNFAFLAENYPDSDYNEESEFLLCRSQLLTSRDAKHDAQPLREARDGLRIFLRNRPESPYADRAREEIQKTEALLAHKLWRTAEFYLRRRQGPSASLYYNAILADFPDSPYAAKAEKKLARLPQKTDENEKEN